MNKPTRKQLVEYEHYTLDSKPAAVGGYNNERASVLCAAGEFEVAWSVVRAAYESNGELRRQRK